MSQWNQLKFYVNSIKIEKIIYRYDITWKFYRDNCVYHGYTSPPTTMDSYISSLVKLGVLEWVWYGIYKVKAHINPSATISEVRKCAKAEGYRKWFNTVIEVEE